jgi:hypothetical protein
MIIGLACLLACSVSVLALDEDRDVPGIEGVCTATDGSLLGSVRVILYDSRQLKLDSMLTAADGLFRFSGLRPGVYYLECARPGAPSVWYGGATSEPIVVGTTMVAVELVAPQ